MIGSIHIVIKYIMKELYNIVEGIFDVTSSSIDKYTKGKTSEEIRWMIEHSHPKNRRELLYTIDAYCSDFGWDSDLNWIDVSEITDMSYLFYDNPKFNGDISKWDVSNVIYMIGMFEGSQFNGVIKDWNVSNVVNMRSMFKNSIFDGDISKWNVSNVKVMGYMFFRSKFNQDISKWDTSSVTSMEDMFAGSIFNKDISKWDVRHVVDMQYMFLNANFDKDISKWKPVRIRFMDDMFSGCPLQYNPPDWYY